MADDIKKKGVVLGDDDASSEEVDTLLSLVNLNLGPKKKLIVLSLGSLLCHRVHLREKAVANSIPRRPHAVFGNFKGTKFI